MNSNTNILKIYQNDITNLVKIWIAGGYTHEHLFEQQVSNNTDMIETKKYFYDLIMAEIQKQLDTTDNNKIKEHLNGEVQVFFDETGILACISDTSYFPDSDYDYDDYDDY